MKNLIAFFLSFILCQSVYGLKPLVVISDNGGESISNYILKIENRDNDDWEKEAPSNDLRRSENIGALFPVVTKEMSVGKVKSKKIKNMSSTPIGFGAEFAIVGFDKYSWKWLQKKRGLLEKNGTIILVVNVETEKQFNAIKKLMPNSKVQAVPGSDISQQLKINKYPVLISSNGIFQ